MWAGGVHWRAASEPAGAGLQSSKGSEGMVVPSISSSRSWVQELLAGGALGAGSKPRRRPEAGAAQSSWPSRGGRSRSMSVSKTELEEAYSSFGACAVSGKRLSMSTGS